MKKASLKESQLDLLAHNGWITYDDFLTPNEVLKIQEDIAFWQQEEAFKQAGVGKLVTHQIDKTYRRDKIKWIEPNSCQPNTKIFIHLINDLMQQFKTAFFLPLKDFECHYAIYNIGDFYKRHSDQFNSHTHRILSVVLYLNMDWKPGDGGELILYLKDNQEVKIEPLGGRLAIFKSEIEHEVLPAKSNRKSITGWMKDQYNELNFL
jgi:SM-20-related protein